MNIAKAYAISDAKISFMSLVDKAANKREFLITKAENGTAAFTYSGRIIKTDEATHYVTGIAYEPMKEDAHGNYMTEEEIIKAAYWFAKNGDKVDLQHSFETMDDAAVVENWVTKSEETIGDVTVSKGTWLVTVEVSDNDVWEKISKGEITGFSMGGVGKYSDENVALAKGEKTESKEENTVEQTSAQKKGIFKKLAEAFGFDVIEKGQVKDQFETWQKGSAFWNAVDALTGLLCTGHWDYAKDVYVYDFEGNEEKIREALSDFQEIITEVLLQKSITKAIYPAAPAKPIIMKTEEEIDMTKEDIQKMIDDTVAKAATPPAIPAAATPSPAPVTKADDTSAPVTSESIAKMVEAAVQKALNPEDEPDEGGDGAITEEAVQDMVEEAVQKALAPILKARGIPTNLNDDTSTVQKNEPHYLAGIL